MDHWLNQYFQKCQTAATEDRCGQRGVEELQTSVSNYFYMKILEKVVVKHLESHLKTHRLHDNHQSACYVDDTQVYVGIMPNAYVKPQQD